MKKEYHKLVRDRTPEIIELDGFSYRIETLDEREFQQALREKIVEEAQEVMEARPDELVNELADLYEVIDTLMGQYSITEEEVRARQIERAQERGRFIKRILLLEIFCFNTLKRVGKEPPSCHP